MTAPIITVLRVTKTRISKKADHNITHVYWSSDQPLAAWEVRIDGVGQGSGTLIDSVSGRLKKQKNILQGMRLAGRIIAASPAGSSKEIVLEAGVQERTAIEANDLTSGDRTYRVTIYGQNMAGEWSSYG